MSFIFVTSKVLELEPGRERIFQTLRVSMSFAIRLSKKLWSNCDQDFLT